MSGLHLRWPTLSLWTRLAAFAAVGVIMTHAAHLVIANRITSRSLSREQSALGRNIARQVARQAAEAVLVDDALTLHDLVAGAAEGEGVAYCFIVRDGRVLASSFQGATPPALIELQRDDGRPIMVVAEDTRYLDLREPILGGSAGEVRLGLDMAVLGATRHDLAVLLGLLAVAVILVCWWPRWSSAGASPGRSGRCSTPQTGSTRRATRSRSRRAVAVRSRAWLNASTR